MTIKTMSNTKDKGQDNDNKKHMKDETNHVNAQHDEPVTVAKDSNIDIVKDGRDEEDLVAFLDHYTVFQILNMIGFLCHNRKYWRHDVVASLCILLGYIWFGFHHVRLRDVFFSAHLLHILHSWITGWPDGANHKNMLGFAAAILLPQQLQRVYYGASKETQPSTEGALNVLRWSIFMMYFFAGFHKINTDFLFEPTVSCAYDKVYTYLELVGFDDLEELPVWMNVIVPPVVLLIEMVPAITLIWHGGNVSIQTVSIANFILLHLILLPMGFADFGSIAQSFLILYIHPTVLSVKRSQLPLFFYFYMAGVFVLFETLSLLCWYLSDEDTDPFFEAECALILMGHGIMWTSVFSNGLKTPTTTNTTTTKRKGETDKIISDDLAESSSPLPVNVHFPKSIVGMLTLGFFFFFAMNPYLGLRTAGNLTMFSNLRVEGPKSNHLLLRNNPLKLFNYQDDAVEVLDVDDEWDYKFGAGHIAPRVLFDTGLQLFCSKMEDLRSRRQELRRRRHEGNDEGNKSSDVEEYSEEYYMRINYKGTVMESYDICNDPDWSEFHQLRPLWERKFLNMRGISKDGPQRCTW